MASPHIAGLLAYYLSLQPEKDSEFFVEELTPKKLKANLISIATKGALTDVPADTGNFLAWNGGGSSNYSSIIKAGDYTAKKSEEPTQKLPTTIEELEAAIEKDLNILSGEIVKGTESMAAKAEKVSKKIEEVVEVTSVSEPRMIHDRYLVDIPAVEIPPSDVTLEPLDVTESPTIRTKLRLYAILSALYLALFISALDQTVISIAIPTICADLHSASGYVWIGGAYLLASAAAGPIWAKCSDIWGRKSLLLVAVALFTAASILAALSFTMLMLICGRAIQGTAAGGLIQLVIITISDLFSVRKRSLYLGFVGFVWALAGSAGPLIGGTFTQFKSWRWCFWINLPISGVAFVLLFLFLDVHNPRTKLGEGIKAMDWLGAFSILAVTLLLLIGLDFGGTIFPWNSPKVVCLIVFGTLMIGFFLFSEYRLAKYPLISPAVFRSWSNNATFFVVFSHGMVLIGIEYYLPLYFQSVRQSSPLRSGKLLQLKSS